MEVVFIKYSPQRSGLDIVYSFNDEKVTAKINSTTDTFDFSDTENGFINSVKTKLIINPIINAKRVDGELYIELLRFIGYKADVYKKHTEWIEV